MGVPSVPLYLLIADVATKNWCRLTNGLGRLGQLWQVWQQPPRVPQTLDSPLHHPIVGTRYLSPRSPLLTTTLWKLSHLSLLLTWLVKDRLLGSKEVISPGRNRADIRVCSLKIKSLSSPDIIIRYRPQNVLWFVLKTHS